MNWPRWAVINLKPVMPGKNRWYETETRQGKGCLKVLSSKPSGILDHQWQDPQASWTVPARIVPNRGGCTFNNDILSIARHGDQEFEAAARDVDTELNKVKEILEK